MKILVLSDTHGSITKAREVIEKNSRIDLIIHCGDGFEDAKDLEDIYHIKTVAVRGNNDMEGPDIEKIDAEGISIMVTHGHMFSAYCGVTNLLYKAEEMNCDIVCFGHTHIPLCEDEDGIKLLNPGSLTYPSDRTNGSYGIITIEDGIAYANIVYYDTVCGNKNNKPKGGKIRGMLNYSDRF